MADKYFGEYTKEEILRALNGGKNNYAFVKEIQIDDWNETTSSAGEIVYYHKIRATECELLSTVNYCVRVLGIDVGSGEYGSYNEDIVFSIERYTSTPSIKIIVDQQVHCRVIITPVVL